MFNSLTFKNLPCTSTYRHVIVSGCCKQSRFTYKVLCRLYLCGLVLVLREFGVDKFGVLVLTFYESSHFSCSTQTLPVRVTMWMLHMPLFGVSTLPTPLPLNAEASDAQSLTPDAYGSTSTPVFVLTTALPPFSTNMGLQTLSGDSVDTCVNLIDFFVLDSVLLKTNRTSFVSFPLSPHATHSSLVTTLISLNPQHQHNPAHLQSKALTQSP